MFRPILLMALLASAAAAQAAPKTRVVVLGVEHSAQLVSPLSQPATVRAFLDRLAPAGIAIERDPESFARNDHYEFTYEIQGILVPYARARGIPLFPIDWIPPVEDQLLAFGLDLDRPPALRPASGFQSFQVFVDSAVIRQPLFWADAESSRANAKAWYRNGDAPSARDFPRRLYLYRTSLQARRIARAAAELRGKTLLVVIGQLHKDEVEQILGADPGIEIVQPSATGPEPGDRTDDATRAELAAIATMNLLGQQSRRGPVDRAWVTRVVRRLEAVAPGPETELFAARLASLTGAASSAMVDRYRKLAEGTAADVAFTWTGVKFRDRIDSFIDPFGNLTVRNRARLEWARALLRLGRADEAGRIRGLIEADVTPAQRVQLAGYWEEFVAQE